MRISRFNENYKEELKGIALMNYLNDATGKEYFKNHNDDYINLNLSRKEAYIFYKSRFTIDYLKDWFATTGEVFIDLIDVLNDEEAMELYIDSKELGLL